ncbi:MAG: GAF domain-containing sensor histidine kinase [Dehalococcoidales bacterium]|nr:GAF domain-containing sensor histidine kinase [Dehalococcoidales bacterium]
MTSDRSKKSGSYRPRAKTKRQQPEVLVLSRISAALSGLWDLDAILGVGLESALEIMNGTIGEILLIDEKTQSLSHVVHRGYSQEFVENVRISLGEGITGSVAQTGKAVLLEDISSDPQVANRETIIAEGLKAYICVPLRARDKVLGVLNVASREAQNYTTNDMHTLYAIGDQLGIAIEQAMLYERLRSARERMRRLARYNLVAEEDERRRIARELHDETSQSLSGIALQLQALIEMSNQTGYSDEAFAAGLTTVQSLTVQVHNEVSRLISNLHPALLDTLGLAPAVRQHAETRLQSLGCKVNVEFKGNVERFPPDIEAALFRFVQGAVGNISQHSKAQSVHIVLTYQPSEFSMTIRDDGQGFDVSEITDVEESGRGRGLFSMRERIGFLGGTSGIESEIGKGTTVWAKVPVGQEIHYEKNKSTDS